MLGVLPRTIGSSGGKEAEPLQANPSLFESIDAPLNMIDIEHASAEPTVLK